MTTSRLAALALVSLLAVPWSAARGQTVQLPTQTVFSVGTTVLVPDRGRVHLGGVSRARESRVQRGVPLLNFPLTGNVGRGRELSSSALTVGATIHDMDELDRAVLAAARGAGRAPTEDELLAARLTRYMGRRTGATPTAPRPAATPASAADDELVAARLSRHMGRAQ